MYNDQKKFGFILGEDGADRFFHISNVKSIDVPTQGAVVEFVPAQGEKGLIAKDIYLQVVKNRPDFIVFGDIRIKLSNIKNYGLSSEEYTVSAKKELTSVESVLGTVDDLFDLVAIGLDLLQGEPIYRSVYETKERKYLYVTTYQNDNYTFYEDIARFNIREKCNELDKWLS